MGFDVVIGGTTIGTSLELCLECAKTTIGHLYPMSHRGEGFTYTTSGLGFTESYPNTNLYPGNFHINSPLLQYTHSGVG